MKARVTRHRFSILIAVIVALSVNTLSSLTGVSNANSNLTPVKVITGIAFDEVIGSGVDVAPGTLGKATANCPADDDAVAGGYVAEGSYVLTPPSVNLAYPFLSHYYAHIVVPKTDSTVSFKAEVVCAKISYGTVMSG